MKIEFGENAYFVLVTALFVAYYATFSPQPVDFLIGMAFGASYFKYLYWNK